MKLKNKVELMLTLFVILVGYIFLPKIYRSHIKINKLYTEKKSLELEEKNVRIRIAGLDKSIAELNNDYFIEKQAREKLKMKKKGEKIYRLTD